MGREVVIAVTGGRLDLVPGNRSSTASSTADGKSERWLRSSASSMRESLGSVHTRREAWGGNIRAICFLSLSCYFVDRELSLRQHMFLEVQAVDMGLFTIGSLRRHRLIEKWEANAKRFLP